MFALLYLSNFPMVSLEKKSVFVFFNTDCTCSGAVEHLKLSLLLSFSTPLALRQPVF